MLCLVRCLQEKKDIFFASKVAMFMLKALQCSSFSDTHKGVNARKKFRVLEFITNIFNLYRTAYRSHLQREKRASFINCAKACVCEICKSASHLSTKIGSELKCVSYAPTAENNISSKKDYRLFYLTLVSRSLALLRADTT